MIGVPDVIRDGTEGVASGALAGGSGFGSSLYALGDLDGDGQDDLSTGDQSDDDAGSNSGAVYILFLNPGSEADAVKSFLKITPATSGLSGVAPTGQGLTTMSTIGDLDGDGREEVAFGLISLTADSIIVAKLGSLTPSASPTPSVTPSSSPTASVTPSPAAVGTVFDAVKVGNNQGGLPDGIIESSDSFGYHMTSIGDIDGDGIPDIAVGARYDDDGLQDAGAAYIIFMNSNRTAKGFQKISAIDGGFDQYFDPFQ